MVDFSHYKGPFKNNVTGVGGGGVGGGGGYPKVLTKSDIRGGGTCK